jgi:uncharacterized protein (TIGR02284 family)
MSTNTDLSKLDDLIVTTIDSVKGYDHAADHAAAARYADMFRALATERRSVVATLQEQSRVLGGTPSDFGSAAATLHRRFEDLRRALGGGDEAIVKEVERGEDYLKEEFERALRDTGISVETRAIMDGCYAMVKRGHDEVSRLKHQLAAAD